MSYHAPIRDLGFTLKHVLGLEELQATGAYPDLDADLVDAVLEAAGQVSEGTLAPLNVSGDRAGARLEGDGVIPAPGFGEAYRTFVEGGWMGLAAPVAHGGIVVNGGMPVFAALFSWFIFGEGLGRWRVAGVALNQAKWSASAVSAK